MKDRSLKVCYQRNDKGELYVWLYRGKLYLGTVQVNEFNCIKVIRGLENRAPVFVKYIQKVAMDEKGNQIMY